MINLSYKKLKSIDCIINCSGVFYYDKIKNMNYKDLSHIFKINCFSTIMINKNVFSKKSKKDSIKIITCGSSSAVIGSKDTVAYCASKHALLGTIKSLNQTYIKNKIFNYCLNFGTLDNKKGKLIKTSTPIVEFEKIQVLNKKKYDMLYISSDWYQNHLSLNNFFKRINYEKIKFNILILGDLSLKIKNNINIKSYSAGMFDKCKIGVAIMKNSTGRQTKIFEMLSAGLPLFTNINLSEFGLKNNFHYKYFDKRKNLVKQLNSLISNKFLRKKISRNAFKWSKKNTFYKKAFERLNNQILIQN